MITNSNNIYGLLLNNINKYKNISMQATKMLSTGKRINSASDSPSDILRINRLNSKINGTTVANRNIQDGISLIQTAENSLNEINNIGKRLKELSVSYNNETLSDNDKKLIENESKALLEEIQNIQKNTKFNNLNVFSQNNYTIQTGSNCDDSYTINISGININQFTSKSDTVQNSNIIPNNDLQPIAVFAKSRTVDKSNVDNSKIVIDLNGYPEITSPGNFKDTPIFNVSDGDHAIYNNEGTLIYKGGITNGKCNGYGTLYNNDGSIYYEGNFTDGVYDQYGTFYNQDGSILYQGGLKNGECHGYGAQYFNDNIKYEGYFSDGKKNGYGTLSKNYNTIYQGEWKDEIPVTGLSSNETITLPNTPSNGSSNNPSNGNNSDGSIDKPSDNNNGGTITPPVGGNDSNFDNPSGDNNSDGSIDKPSDNNNGGTITPPVGGNDSNVDNPSGDNNSDGSIDKPSDNNNGGTITPPVGGNDSNVDNPSDDALDFNILLGDNVDKYILDPVSESLNSLGIQERILNHRYNLNETQNATNTEHLSKIEDVDIASALLEKVKADILLQTTASLFSEQLTLDRSYIATLLS